MSAPQSRDDALFSVAKDDVVAECAARIAIGDLRAIPLTNLPRAGAYMAARLRAADVLCLTALDASGLFLEDKLLRIGDRIDPPTVKDAAVSLSEKTGSKYMIVGASKKLSGKMILSLNELYADMLDYDMTIIDVIEVTGGAFESVMKTLSNNTGGYYKAFIQK